MKNTRQDVLIVGDNGVRSPLRWFTERLAKHPGWVTSITFVGGAIVAWVVLEVDGRLTLTDTITLLATLWALFFAVMIYLLSASDTDHILDQISDLQDQLSTALGGPGDDEGSDGESPDAAVVEDGGEDDERSDERAPETTGVVEKGPVVPATDAPGTTTTPTTPPTADGRTTKAKPPAGALAPRAKPRAGARPAERGSRQRPHGVPIPILTTPEEIAETVPGELVAGWTEATGRPAGAIRRAWTRDPGMRQWVLETDDDRWLAFFRHDEQVALVPLRADARWGGERRSRPPKNQPRGGGRTGPWQGNPGRGAEQGKPRRGDPRAPRP